MRSGVDVCVTRKVGTSLEVTRDWRKARVDSFSLDQSRSELKIQGKEQRSRRYVKDISAT